MGLILEDTHMAKLNVASVARFFATKGTNGKTSVKVTSMHSVRLIGSPEVRTDEGLAALADKQIGVIKGTEKYETPEGTPVSHSKEFTKEEATALLLGDIEIVEEEEGA